MKRNLDYLWSRNIIDSFTKDDVKMLEKTFSSSFFDIEEVVEGGEYGTPYSIGEYAFFSENQFLHQKQSLMDLQRQLAKETKHMLLTEKDWLQIEYQAKEVAYYGTHSFTNVIRGDTFLNLAIRKGSFKVCKLLLQYIMDTTCNMSTSIEVEEPNNHNNAAPLSRSSCLQILFALNESNEAYIDILQSKMLEIISLLRETEMSIPSTSLSLYSSSFTISTSSLVSNSMSQASKNSKQQQPFPSSSSSSVSSYNKQRDGEDDVSDFSLQIELFKTKQILKSHLADLTDITDFILFLVDIYLPQLSQLLQQLISRNVSLPSNHQFSHSQLELFKEMNDANYEMCIELGQEGKSQLTEHSSFVNSFLSRSTATGSSSND